MAVLLMSFSSPTVLATFLLFHRCPPFPFRYLQNISLTFSVQAVLLKVPSNVSSVVTYLPSPCLAYLSPPILSLSSTCPTLAPLPRPERKGRIALKSEHSRVRAAEPTSRLSGGAWRTLHRAIFTVSPFHFHPILQNPPPLLASPWAPESLFSQSTGEISQRRRKGAPLLENVDVCWY